MQIKDIVYGNGIVKAVIKGDKGIEYTTSYDSQYNKTWCTCPWWVLNKEVDTCKHILYLLDNIEFDKMKPKKKYKNFLCGCLTIDTLMGSGFPQGSVTAVFGESGQGKTLLTAQLALSCIKNLDKDVIIIETEGNREQDYLELLNRFKDRFDLTEDEIRKKVHFHAIIEDFQKQSKAMVDLLKLVGYETEIDRSKKGDKFTITFKDCKPRLKEDELKRAGMIVIDSLTKPLKASIGHKTQNLPARAELTARFFARLYSIASNYDIAVIINHHASVNKAMAFARDFGSPYGGDEVFYNSKYIIEFINSDMTARAKFADCEHCKGKGAKRIMLIKHPYQPITSQMFPIHLKNNFGFTDDL